MVKITVGMKEMGCGMFDKGFLLAELIPTKMMEEKMHDTVKNGYLLGRG